MKIDPLRFYRVKDWIKNLGIPLIGFLTASWLNANLLLIVFATSLILSYAYSINNLFDFLINGEKNYIYYLSKKGVSEKKSALLCFLPFLIFFLINFYLPIWASIIGFSCFTLSSLYSFPKVRLKNYWLPSLLVNSVGLGILLFLFGFFFGSTTISMQSIIFMIILFIHILSLDILHQIAHRKIDKKFGIKTFPQVFGIRKSLRCIIYLQLIVIFVCLITFLYSLLKYSIFLGSILFSFLKIRRILKCLRSIYKIDYNVLRNKMYGMWEGIFYVVFLLMRQYFVFPY